MKRIGIVNCFGQAGGNIYRNEVRKEINKRSDTAFDTGTIELVFTGMDEFLEDIGRYWNSIAGHIVTKAFGLKNTCGCDYVALSANILANIDIVPECELQKALYEENPLKKDWEVPRIIDVNDSIINGVLEQGLERILLLGPDYVMYNKVLQNKYASKGITLVDVVEYNKEIKELDRIIKKELSFEFVTDESTDNIIDFVNQICEEKQPDAIVLGCPELTLAITQEDIIDGTPLINSTILHAKDLVDLLG